jgi:hypothetical protein
VEGRYHPRTAKGTESPATATAQFLLAMAQFLLSLDEKALGTVGLE